VSPLQAGVVRLNGHDYSSALAALEQVDADGQDAGQAGLIRAEALLKLGSANEARQTLGAVADSDSPQAGAALLRLGQLYERDDELLSAERMYLVMVARAPERGSEAWFHVGFARFARGDRAGALAAWQNGLAARPASPTWQA